MSSRCALSGVRSDGFQSTGSPQTSASAAFQLHTATGKLNALIDRDRPERVPRLRQPMAGALGRDRAAVELPRETDREVADVDHLLHLAETLLLDLPDLERDERAERLLLAAQLLAEQPHELAARAAPARRATPRTPSRRARDRGVRLGLVGARDASELLARDRRPDDEVAVRTRLLVDAEARRAERPPRSSACRASSRRDCRLAGT